MINILDTLKQAYDVSTTQIDKIIVDNKEYPITNVEYYDDTYENGNIFGTAIARCLDFEIENIVNLEGKEVEYYTGIKANNVTQWINLGKFIVQSVEPNNTTNIAKINAIDYMLKTNIEYNSTLNYIEGTVTLLDVLQEVCTKSGLTLATLDFPNSTFIVDSNQFAAEGTLNRQVIQAIAQISGTVAKIKNDNKLYLINPNSIATVSKIFTLNNYQEAEIKRNTQPINAVSLGMSNVEGENVTLRDEASITQNGENILIINDNPFAYTQAKRQQLITAIFNAVKDFEYKAFSFKCQGLPYLEATDKVQFKDKEGNTYNSYVFRFNYKSPKGLESTIEAPSIIKATVNYQNVLSAVDIAKRTEIIVDKQNQTIESVVSSVEEQNTKISQITQSLDQIKSEISEVADVTISADGYGSISLDNINESEPVRIELRPRIGEDIAYLHPRNNLYPSDTLFLKNRKIRFETESYVIDYELPTDLLYYDANNYDEFVLDYEGQSCIVNKKVAYNADGTKYLLENPTTLSFPYPNIPLQEGNYTITVLGYPNAYIFARLMVQNIYTSQFATKAEVNSKISQTSKEIDLSVNQKLSNYSTTTQMNSAINLKAGEITSSVNETFETKESANTKYSQIQQTTDNISIEVGKKVGNNEVIAKINASPEAVGINANKIELSATDVLNLLAGNTINLSSKNITIKSDVLTIDEKGNLTLKHKGTRVFKVENEDNNRQRVYITDNGVVVDSATDYDRASIGLLGNNDGIVSVTSSGRTKHRNFRDRRYNSYINADIHGIYKEKYTRK